MRRRYHLLANLVVVAGALFIVRYALGWSQTNAEPVSQAIFERLPATIELALVALAAAVVLGAIVGFGLARTRAPLLRGLLHGVQLLGRAMPVVVVALVVELVLVFTALVPGAGIASRDAFDLGDRLRHVIAPALCLAVPFGAWMSMIFWDFFHTTRRSTEPSGRHIIRPVAMSIALVGPALLSASLLIEPMFAWPGVARLFYAAMTRFDAGVVAGCLLMYGAALALLNLGTELASRMPDAASPPQTGLLRTSAGAKKRLSAITVIAIAVLLCAGIGAVAADLIAPGPYMIDQAHWVGYPLAPGVAGHVLGTDVNGRDLLSRVLVGLRTSLEIAAMAAIIASAIAFVVAKVTQASRRRDDGAALSVVGIRAFAGLPFVLAAITVVVVKSHQGVQALSPVVIALIIAAVSWPAIVPAFRTRTSAMFGATIDLMACALLLEVTQSAIGFGVQPLIPSLGNMLVGVLSNIMVGPWIPIVPIVVVVAVLFALYAVADDLRERAHGS